MADASPDKPTSTSSRLQELLNEAARVDAAHRQRHREASELERRRTGIENTVRAFSNLLTIDEWIRHLEVLGHRLSQDLPAGERLWAHWQTLFDALPEDDALLVAHNAYRGRFREALNRVAAMLQSEDGAAAWARVDRGNLRWVERDTMVNPQDDRLRFELATLMMQGLVSNGVVNEDDLSVATDRLQFHGTLTWLNTLLGATCVQLITPPPAPCSAPDARDQTTPAINPLPTPVTAPAPSTSVALSAYDHEWGLVGHAPAEEGECVPDQSEQPRPTPTLSVVLRERAVHEHVETDSVDTQMGSKNTKGKMVEAQMRQLCAQDPDRRFWSADRFAKEIECAASSVVENEFWLVDLAAVKTLEMASRARRGQKIDGRRIPRKKR